MDTYTAIIAATAALLGTIIGPLANAFSDKLKDSFKAQKDDPRKKLLLTMLTNKRFKWRKLETLCKVIGADEDTTKRLLIEVGARGSENESNVWGLISRNPFPGED
jgi:hypothetical protein